MAIDKLTEEYRKRADALLCEIDGKGNQEPRSWLHCEVGKYFVGEQLKNIWIASVDPPDYGLDLRIEQHTSNFQCFLNGQPVATVDTLAAAKTKLKEAAIDKLEGYVRSIEDLEG